MTGPRSGAGFDVRDVRPDEYAALGDLTVAAYMTLRGEGEAAFLADLVEYANELRDVATRTVSCRVLVAVDRPAGRILGGVTYVPGPGTPYSESEGPDEAGFRTLAVAPEARGRGVGRALVEECLALARADGRRRLVLLTLPLMTDAHRLYARLGFRRVPDRDFAVAGGLILQGYELDLVAEVEPA